MLVFDHPLGKRQLRVEARALRVEQAKQVDTALLVGRLRNRGDGGRMLAKRQMLREARAHMDELNTVMVVTHDIRSAMIVSDTIFMLGRDRAPDGKVATGARIQHCYDLVAEGLAWRPGVEHDPHFLELEREVKERFRNL